MSITHSRLTTQGEILVPDEVRKKLGVGPGSLLEWHYDGQQVIVRRAGRYSSEELHQALFSTPPAVEKLVEKKTATRKYIRKKHTRK